jgi:hypothetical protein
MLIKWKPLKYRHILQAQELGKEIEEGAMPDGAIVEFVMSLIESWDAIDDETGQVIPLQDYAEMTLPQFNELMTQFNAAMTGNKVKKTIAEPSSYSVNGSKRVKKGATFPEVSRTG